MEVVTDGSDTVRMAVPASASASAPSSVSEAQLSPEQLHALLDILTHAEMYDEVQSFKDPQTIFAYGYPFVRAGVGRKGPKCSGGSGPGSGSGPDDDDNSEMYASPPVAPILHMMLNKMVLSLPLARTLPPSFWHERVQGLMALLAEAELSESYDQGAMGTRKTFATGSSALAEYLGRGMLAGYRSGSPLKSRSDNVDINIDPSRTYSTTDTSGFTQAWEDVLRAMVYGDLIDELFSHMAEHDDLESHSSAVKTAVDYIIIQLAEFLHYVFVRSPNGRNLTKLATYIQQLVPYTVIRQTLRVSNAATMINAMLKVMLAKLSVGGLTNWIGLTTAADDGMNLLQRIISLVLAWDAADFKKTAEKIEKARGPNAATKDHLAAIREHLVQTREQHETIRQDSASSGRSVVAAILEAADPALAASLSEAQHAQCCQYYAALLSVQDRREITNVFCRQSPDLFTQALRDGAAALDPLIRRIHTCIDLKEHVTDLEGFVNEFIEVSRGTRTVSRTLSLPSLPLLPSLSFSSAAAAPAKMGGADSYTILPTVKDYVELLRRNRHLLYKWLHRLAAETPDIRDMFRDWAVETIKLFRMDDTDGSSGSAGAMTVDICHIYSALPLETRTQVQPLIEAHAKYLAELDAAAASQRQSLVDKVYGTDRDVGDADDDDGNEENDGDGPDSVGSGRFLARWQDLLDNTVIGPATANGPLRCGRDIARVTVLGKVATVAMNGAAPSSKKSARSSRRSSPARCEQPLQTKKKKKTGGGEPAPDPPDVQLVVQALKAAFKQAVVARCAATV